MTRILILVAGVILLAASAQAQDLYKWVDEDGNVTYQDSPPPGDAGAAKPFAEDAEVAAEIAAEKDALPDVPVTLYSVPVCEACDLVRNMLQKYGVPFDEKDASDNVAVQKKVKEIAGQLTVPVLAVGDSVVTGYSSSSITAELTSAGFTPVREGAPADTENAPQGGLSEEEVAQQAAEAAAQLTADLEELPDDASFQEDVVEEIPEEEQIKVKLGE
jgi:glutaredoxin